MQKKIKTEKIVGYTASDQSVYNEIIRIKGYLDKVNNVIEDEIIEKSNKQRVNEYMDNGTEYRNAVNGLLDMGITNYDDIAKYLGLTNVGSDTDTALPEEVAKTEIGTKAGQCGRFVNANTGLGVGDSYQSKIAKMDSSITEPEAGMVFVMPYKDTGHTGFVVDVQGDKVLVKDSNWSLDETVKEHWIDKK